MKTLLKIPRRHLKTVNLIKNVPFEGLLTNPETILDIGSAAGDFLRYLEFENSNFTLKSFYGIDVMDSLLIEAEKRMPTANFKKWDVNMNGTKIKDAFKMKFDLITMHGVHTIFDDLYWLENILYSLNKICYAIIYSFFNNYPYDVVTRVRKSGSTHWEPGWNVHSKKSITDFCYENKFKAKFIDFNLNIEIPQNHDDYLRTWSVNLKEDESFENTNSFDCQGSYKQKIYTNATRIIHDFSHCIISHVDNF